MFQMCTESELLSVVNYWACLYAKYVSAEIYRNSGGSTDLFRVVQD